MQETQEMWVQSLGWKIPWSRKWQPTPIFLPGESHGQGSLAGYSLGGHKETDMTEHARTCTLKISGGPDPGMGIIITHTSQPAGPGHLPLGWMWSFRLSRVLAWEYWPSPFPCGPRCRPQKCCRNRRKLGWGGVSVPAQEASAQRLRGRAPRVIRSLIPTIAWIHSRSFCFSTQSCHCHFIYFLCVFFKFLKIAI